MKKNHLPAIIISVCSAAVVLLGAFAAINLLSDWRIEMIPAPYGTVTVECGENFAAPTVRAVFRGNLFLKDGVPVDVSASGGVNTKKPGEYPLNWHADWFIFSADASMTVSVKDTTPPTLTLTPETRKFILPGTEYDDPGYSAVDTAEGDVTDRVTVSREDNGKTLTLTYSVADSSGNTSTAVREVKYNDPEPPKLTLSGDTNVKFYAGRESYKEPGFAASDNVDGDITDRVRVTGTVENDKPGTYVLRYTVKDSWGNSAEAERKVTVLEPPKPRKVTVQKDYPVTGPLPDRVIYLTFDDGPGAYTEQLLDVLKKHNVKATFFVTGNGRHDLIARESAEGHSVGVHTMNHNYYAIYSSEDAFWADVWAVNEIIKEQTGSYSSLLRFPGGSSNSVSRFNPGIMTRLAREVKEAGFTYFDWNVSSGDAGETTVTSQVYKNVINGISGKNVAVVLQHDIKGFSVAAVEDIIEWGLANGYTFLPLTPDSPTAHHRIFN